LIYRLRCSAFALCILLSLAASAQAQSTITIGETKVLTLGDSGNANLLPTQHAALSEPATIQSLSFYVTTASGQLRLGIYDATGPHGGPGKLKAQTNAFKTVKGWNTAKVTAPVVLSAGTYWLAYLPSSKTLSFVKGQTSGVSIRYYAYNSSKGTMPGTFSTSPASDPYHWSFYATLTPTGSSSVPPPSPVNGVCGSSNGANVHPKRADQPGSN
jgi:hypothetical protein